MTAQTEAMKLALEALEAIAIQGDLACVVTPDGVFYLQPAITALREALAEQPAQRKSLPYNKADMMDLDINQRLAFKLGWKSAEEAHGIKENT